MAATPARGNDMDPDAALALRSEPERESFIYTSVRWDPAIVHSPENTAASFNIPSPFYLLEHHWTRLQIAEWSAQFWPEGVPPKANGRPAEFLYSLLQAVKQWQRDHPKEAAWAEALRIRRRTYAGGRVTTEIWQIPRQPLSALFPRSFELPKDAAKHTPWTVVLDDQPTEATEATMYKISDRTPQGRARASAGILSIGMTKEVLMYNSDSQIIDGSNSTPYFYRNGGWVTPVSGSGGLQGTTRRWALEQGLCSESVVCTDSFKDGEIIWLSNAVRGFFWSVYHTRDPNLRPSSPAEAQQVMRQLV